MWRVIRVNLGKIFFIIFTIFIMLTGCAENNTQDIMSEELIISKIEDIDDIQIDINKQEFKQTEDKEVIRNLYKNLSGIKMKKLTAEKENSFMKNNEILYVISLSSGQKIVGAAMIFSNGDMTMYDVTTMYSKQRTQAYIHYTLDNERLQSIISIIETLK